MGDEGGVSAGRIGLALLLGLASLFLALFAEEHYLTGMLALLGLAAVFFLYAAVLWRARGPGAGAK